MVELEKHMKKKPLADELNERFKTALETFHKAEIERTEDLCIEILQEDPLHANTLNLMGVVFLKQGAYERAAKFIQRAMQQNLEKAPIFSYNLALSYNLMGNIPLATAVYKESALTFEERGDMFEAINCLEKAALINRENGHITVAHNLYQRIIELDPTNVSAHNNSGALFLRIGDHDKAARCFNQILQIDSENVAAYTNLGLIFLSQKKLDEAIVVLEKALELDSTCVEAHINLGNVYLDKEQLDKALEHYQKGIELSPNLAGLHNNLGIILQAQSKIQQAILAYKKALELDPNYEDAKKHLDLAEKEDA
jgi:tetratricopeptide (TPR) repeat protein